MGDIYVDGLVPGVSLHFTLKNIHFHAHSEHTIAGHYYPLEMHMVHSIHREHAKYARLTKLVIGVLFDVTDDSDNPMLRDFKLDTLEV